jgi:hypothetical protein
MAEEAQKSTTAKERVRMQADIKRALAWGFGLGVGFAVAGMALGVFRKVR